MTVPVKPQERQITSCMKRAGPNARPSYKHCKTCEKHAHAPPPRVRTRLHGFHLVGFSNQPVSVQLTTSSKILNPQTRIISPQKIQYILLVRTQLCVYTTVHVEKRFVWFASNFTPFHLCKHPLRVSFQSNVTPGSVIIHFIEDIFLCNPPNLSFIWPVPFGCRHHPTASPHPHHHDPTPGVPHVVMLLQHLHVVPLFLCLETLRHQFQTFPTIPTQIPFQVVAQGRVWIVHGDRDPIPHLRRQLHWHGALDSPLVPPPRSTVVAVPDLAVSRRVQSLFGVGVGVPLPCHDHRPRCGAGGFVAVAVGW